MNDKNIKVTVSGTALLSTIATMESLGPIGEEVLKENGIKEVIETKQYPIEIRNAIFKAILIKYGEVALLDMGYKNADIIYNFFTVDVINLSKKEKQGLISNDNSKNIASLEKILYFYANKADEFIKNVTTGFEIDYGFKLKKVNNFEYILIVTMALEPYSEPFMRGVQVGNLIQILGKYYTFVLKYKKNNTKSGYGFSTWSWSLKLTRKLSKQTIYQIWSEKKNETNKALMKEVLSETFIQNKKIKKLSQQIGKFIPPQINEALLKGNFNTEIKTKRKKLTIFLVILRILQLLQKIYNLKT